jgi:AraC-like DNA-binding protein
LTTERRLVVRSLAETYAAGHALRFHSHDWHQLVFASAGVLAVEVPPETWIVPPVRAVWVPAGTSHRLVARTRASLRTIYVEPSLAPGRETIAVFAVPRLLRELILHIVAIGMLDADVPEHDRLACVFLDQLAADADEEALRIVQPVEPIARAAAELLAAEPGRSIDDVARVVGTSRRSLERSFSEHAGTTLGRWRQQVRLARSLELLSAGASVTETGANVGYATTSAFIDAFRREFGATPSRYFANG